MSKEPLPPADSPSANVPPDAAPQPVSGCFFRLIWLALGPALAMVLLASVGLHQPSLGSTADIAFGALVLISIAARVLDRSEASPGAGRYAAVIGLGGAALWVVLRVLLGA